MHRLNPCELFKRDISPHQRCAPGLTENTIPNNTRSPNVVFLSGQRRRRWPNGDKSFAGLPLLFTVVHHFQEPSQINSSFSEIFMSKLCFFDVYI